MVDRKFEPLVKRLMVKYLGELEDDDLVMFVLEHLKDHKGPAKLIEGLEPVSRSRSPLTTDSMLIRSRFSRRKQSNLRSVSGGRLYSRAWHTEKVYIRRR
jgi:hypothetical protein